MIINSHIINANPGEAGTPTIVQGTLPSAYRRVLGFTLNDNAYWAITGVTLNGNDTVRISFSVSEGCNVFGCYSSSSATNNFSLYASTTSGAKYLRYGNGTYPSYFSSSNLDRRFDVVVSGTGTSGMPTDSSWTQRSFTGTETFCIGTTSTDATSSKLVGNLYGDVVVDGKFYGIPCKRVSDNKLGYYDVISETFFQPTGSGVVSLGNDASITLSPIVTNTTGYITGGTIEGNPTTISASDLVSGTKNLTNTSVTDVTNYANAQIVDANLTAANIANGVTVLGITGTHQGGITPTGTVEISSTDSSNPDDVTNYAGAYVAAGTAGTPTATKGTVNNHSISVTPSVTNTTGYIVGSTKTGASVSVSASELVSGTISTITTSTTDVTNYQYASAPAGTAGTPTATKGTVVSHAIAVTPSVTNTTGYITGGTKTGTAVIVMASELVSGTKNLTDTSSTDVTNYASAQVVDSNLTAGNIKKDVSILGVTGTYEGSGGLDIIGTSTTYTVNDDTDVGVGNFVSAALYINEDYEGSQTGLSGSDEPAFCHITDDMYFGFSFSSKTSLYTYFVQTDNTGIKSLKYATTTITSFQRYSANKTRTYIHKLSSTKAIGIITTYAASTTYPNAATIIVFDLTVGSTPAASSCSIGSQTMIAKPSWTPGIPSAAFYDVSGGVNIAIFEPYRTGTGGYSRLHLYYASTSGTLTFEETAADSGTPTIRTDQGCAVAWIDGRRLAVAGPNNSSAYIAYTSSYPLIVKEVDLKTDVQSSWSTYTPSFTNISYTMKSSGSQSVGYYLSAAYFNSILHIVSCHSSYIYYLDLQRTGVETYTQVGLGAASVSDATYTQNGIVPMQSGKTFVINYSTSNGGGSYVATSPTTLLYNKSVLVAKYNGFLRDANGFLLTINNYAFGFCQIQPTGQSGNILLPIKVLINPSTEAAQLQCNRSKSGDTILGVCTSKTVTATSTTLTIIEPPSSY